MNDWVFEVDQTSGTQLAARLVQIGRDEKLSRIVASIDIENREMRVVSERAGFTVSYDAEEQLMMAHLDL